MKQYLLSVYQPDGPPPPPEMLEPIMRELEALHRDIKQVGAWVFTGGLHASSTATVVRQNEDDFLVTDGPYIEGKEHLGGFLIIKANDLDEALDWAKRAAKATTLPIEVRPFHDEARE